MSDDTFASFEYILHRQKSCTQDELLQILVNNGPPCIAWDWDGTLDLDETGLTPNIYPIFAELTSNLGLGHIIVTARSIKPNIQGWQTKFLPRDPIIVWNDKNEETEEFKSRTLKALFNDGNGCLKLYVDNDKSILQIAIDNGIPACEVKDRNFEYLVQFLKQ